ncbi:MAG: copper chaperone PCu(A)C [Magnetococcales bacterium]|nr:copper chaperone PCu(A)C [Magnetococcales bacterium]
MQTIRLTTLLTMVGLLAIGGCQAAAQSMDHDKMEKGGMHAEQKVMVQQPWARASAGMAKAGAAFMTLMNHGMSDDRLLSASANVSERVELHTHLMDNGVMRMREVPHIDLPKGKMVSLQPGGLHIMFMKLNKPFQEGDSFPLTLRFEKAGTVEIQVVVKGVSAGGMGGGHMQGHSM